MVQQGFAQAQARQNVTLQSYSKLMEAYNATESARAQMLSSILGSSCNPQWHNKVNGIAL
jgi:hypothetical protein